MPPLTSVTSNFRISMTHGSVKWFTQLLQNPENIRQFTVDAAIPQSRVLEII